MTASSTDYILKASSLLRSYGGIATGAVLLTWGLQRLLKHCRVGTRRSSKPTIIHDDDDTLIEERETGLIQQWYTDQPCQRLYGLTFSATFSYDGILRLQNKEHVHRVVTALIHRHPILSTTVVRDLKCNGRASLRRTISKRQCIDDALHPLGPMPVIWDVRENDGSWRDIAHKITHTDIDESSWLFRIVIILPKLQNVPPADHGEEGYRADIIIASNHVITDGMFLYDSHSIFHINKMFFVLYLHLFCQ
jgi:hypothetical protein